VVRASLRTSGGEGLVFFQRNGASAARVDGSWLRLGAAFCAWKVRHPAIETACRKVGFDGSGGSLHLVTPPPPSSPRRAAIRRLARGRQWFWYFPTADTHTSNHWSSGKCCKPHHCNGHCVLRFLACRHCKTIQPMNSSIPAQRENHACLV